MEKARHDPTCPELSLAERPWFSTDDLTMESDLGSDDIQQLQGLCLLLAAFGGVTQDDDGAETPEPVLIAA